MRTIFINRLESNDRQTIGHGVIFDGHKKIFEFETLELAWKNNQKGISCIPPGTYRAAKKHSTKNGDVFELENVPNRTAIQMHIGNYYTDIEGCILSGASFTDINQDGLLDVSDSGKTFKKMYELMPQSFFIVICEL